MRDIRRRDALHQVKRKIRYSPKPSKKNQANTEQADLYKFQSRSQRYTEIQIETMSTSSNELKNLSNPLTGLCFLRRKNAIFDVTQGILTFPYLSM